MGFISKPIFSRLATRFQIRQAASEQLESGQVLVPVTDADRLVRETKLFTADASAVSLDTYFTVPLGKRWIVKALSVERDETGTGYSYLQDPAGNYVVLAIWATATTQVWSASSEIVIEQGFQIRIYSGTGVSGNIYQSLLVEEEDA